VIHALWSLIADSSQTYFSDAADVFIVATGTDEGSRIILWDTTSLPYPDSKFKYLLYL